MSIYKGDSNRDVILYEHIDDRTGDKTYAIGYADPTMKTIILMIGVCGRSSINKRIRKGRYNVVKTTIRHYTSQLPTFD